MRFKFLIAICSALSICVEVFADGEQEVKRGTFPYMAFLYYPDESVVDGTGSRFLRGAILIRPDWLVTSAVGPSIVPDGSNGFPRKTLLARLGAIAIDVNFTLNEDEDEQEREVIQIVRPYNSSATQWWRTDISLMRVLLPFNLTSAVETTTLSYKPGIPEKTCTILVYAKKEGNSTEDRSLMQIYVDMLPPSNLNCGSHYIGNTMTCAADSDDNKNDIDESNFCQGNSGGPLICENEVVGIQTYIDNDCKQPHLYQLLSAWENFITCGTEGKCQEEQCSQICDVINKDPLITTTRFPSETDVSTEARKTLSEKTITAITVTTEEPTEAIETTSEPPPETTTEPTTATTPPPETTTTTAATTTTSTTTEESDEEKTENTIQLSSETESSETLWTNEREIDARKQLDQGVDNNKTTNPPEPARRRKAKPKPRRARSNASSLSICFCTLFGFLILACSI